MKFHEFAHKNVDSTTSAPTCSKPYIILSNSKGFESSAEAGNANLLMILSLFGDFSGILVENCNFSFRGALRTIRIP